jgi:hypothetical protein
MNLCSRSAGLTIGVTTGSARWQSFVREAFAGHGLQDAQADDLHVVIAESPDRFSLRGMDTLARGAWSDGSSVVIENACSSGVDLRVWADGGRLEVEARSRPGWSTRGLATVARARAQLLLRSAILQYPAMWWAGVSGAVPMHVSGVRTAGVSVAIAGPGGVGKSTLLRDAMSQGARGVSDNLCVGRDLVIHGVLEPLRTDGGEGRRMPHGRRESVWPDRLDSIEVERILVLRRGSGSSVVVRPLDAQAAARVIVGGTYAAGELRRYWAFAATLALGTGLGPAHPPITDAATLLARAVPCTEVILPGRPGTRLSDVIGISQAYADELSSEG